MQCMRPSAFNAQHLHQPLLNQRHPHLQKNEIVSHRCHRRLLSQHDTRKEASPKCDWRQKGFASVHDQRSSSCGAGSRRIRVMMIKKRRQNLCNTPQQTQIARHLLKQLLDLKIHHLPIVSKAMPRKKLKIDRKLAIKWQVQCPLRVDGELSE